MNDLLFTVGPVEMFEETKEIGIKQLPYFRTKEFSEVNNRIAENFRTLLKTDTESKVALLTATGTAAMEASVLSTFSKNDKILVIVGGEFGKRFAEICRIYHLNYEILLLERGKTLDEIDLKKYLHTGITGILVNLHETSTGVLYHGKLLGDFSRRIGAILVVDAISTFLADDYKMDEWNIDITIVSSQKALALPPGMAAVIANKKAVNRILANEKKSMYLDLQEYFVNMERGQTPFTTAVGITLQLDQRLQQIVDDGEEVELNRVKHLAEHFRQGIQNYNFIIPSNCLSNALTPIQPPQGKNAIEIYEHLKEKYHIILCPSGGVLKNILLRVGHLGNLTFNDNDRLLEALKEMQKRGLI